MNQNAEKKSIHYRFYRDNFKYISDLRDLLINALVGYIKYAHQIQLLKIFPQCCDMHEITFSDASHCRQKEFFKFGAVKQQLV